MDFVMMVMGMGMMMAMMAMPHPFKCVDPPLAPVPVISVVRRTINVVKQRPIVT